MSLPTYPVVNPAFTPVVTDDSVTFRAGPWSGPAFTLSGNGGPQTLVSELDGETTAESAVEAAGTDEFDAATVLTRLTEKGVVVPAATAAEAYLAARTDAEPADGQLLVVGDGQLAVRLVSDLRAQELDPIRAIGCGPSPPSFPTGVQSELDDLSAAVQRADHVISVTDEPRPETDAQLNELALSTDTRWTRARVDGYDAVVGPTVVPGETACFDCYRVRRDANVPERDGYRRHLADRGTAQGRTLPASFTSLVAGVVGTEVYNQRTDGAGFTGGRVLHYDLYNLSVELNEVLSLPRCESCGDDTTTIDDPRHATLDSLFAELGR